MASYPYRRYRYRPRGKASGRDMAVIGVVIAVAVAAAGHKQVSGTLHQAAAGMPGHAVYAPAGSNEALANQLAASGYGWSGSQASCLDDLWTEESAGTWSPTVTNPASGAYGIPQALPASKMAAAGPDWQTNPATQIRWGLAYIAGRYGTPCGAWSFERSHVPNWY